MQSARHLVRVVIELPACVQLGHHDLGRRTLELVVVLYAGRNSATIVEHRDRIIGVDGDQYLVTIAGQRLVNRVVDDLEHHVVQAGAVGRIPDVHARALANGLQSFQHLDAVGAVLARVRQ